MKKVKIERLIDFRAESCPRTDGYHGDEELNQKRMVRNGRVEPRSWKLLRDN